MKRYKIFSEVDYMRRKEIVKALKMKKHNFPTEIASQFEEIVQRYEGSADEDTKFVEKMDELLTEEQRLMLWEYGGSCTGGATGKAVKAFGLEHSDKPLEVKLDLLKDLNHMYHHERNEDGTFTVTCFCHCLSLRSKKPPKPPLYYGCAAGAALQNFKIALRENVKIKSINYPAENHGDKPITFVLEIAQ
jgi:hypothetical protein